ncbi:MAG: hypothetical protein DI543_04100 [Bradyrhizobium icense]|jgi:hypothetical protein|nr:MAG: hypothetical protein DI543_04100 [Bradyrhizobium icense]
MRQREFIAAIGLATLLVVAGCSPDTSSGPKCIAANFPSYNPANKEQCIAACIKCEKGVTTTCATSCYLKGAR